MSCCGSNAQGGTNADTSSGVTFQPVVDIFETPDEWVINAEVPGATREQVELSLDDGVLALSAPVAARGPSGGVVRREYPVGGFKRSFRIGEGIDASRIGAELVNGVLTVRLPKAESIKPRKIEIQAH